MSVPRRSRRSSRLIDLLAFDAGLLDRANAQHPTTPLTGVIGVDEVGRGSLIGPVVAAAVAFPVGQLSPAVEVALTDLDDSKASHFTHARRVALAECLQAHCYWGIGEASQQEVESRNVAQASLLAGFRAIQQLLSRFAACPGATHLVVIDGKMRIPGLDLEQCPVVKADSQSAAVAAASVIAKAHRDQWVMDLARDYPGYQWETNAGYPTPAHQAALLTLGVTPHHRRTYKVVQTALGYHRQQLLVP